jgi:hypothetical protein
MEIAIAACTRMVERVELTSVVCPAWDMKRDFQSGRRSIGHIIHKVLHVQLAQVVDGEWNAKILEREVH